MDRLGDLICTLPVDQHPLFLDKSNSVYWLISNGLEPVLECTKPKRFYWPTGTSFSWLKFINLIKMLKVENFDKVVLFYSPWWVALACFFASIPERYSPRSRWFQLLFFNHTLRQNRSQSEKHEADYNWELLHWSLTGERKYQLPTPFLYLKSEIILPIQLPNSFIVIHPGMGGSALNWPAKSYLELAQKLSAIGKEFIITGTANDFEWLKELETPLKLLEKCHWLVGKLDLKSLIYVLSRSEATIAPSTGVLHLAAATGAKTIGIYSPIRVQSPKRWAPRGTQTLTLVPSVKCPATKKCLEASCKEYPCLDTITADYIIKEVLKL